MKFGIKTQEALLVAMKKTYAQFLALEMARDFKLGDKSLSQILQGVNAQGLLVPGQPYQFSINIDDQPIHLQLTLEHDDGLQQRISISRIPQKAFSLSAFTLRATNDFDHKKLEDVANIVDILSLTPLTYQYQNGVLNYDKPALNITINNKQLEIGGPDKYNLYNEHLNVLVTLYGYLENSELSSIQTTLAKKTQGSGKTFLQALWFFVLNQAQLSAVFALPDNLTKQFLKDFEKLLPWELVDQIHVIEKNPSDCVLATDELNSLGNSGGARYFIGSYKVILDQHYDTLLNCSGDRVLLSFDEQHKVVKQERRKLRMLALSNTLWTMYLSATSDEQTSSDCKVIATMSQKAKKDAGQGDFSNVHVVRAKKINTLRKKSSLRNKKRLIIKVANQFVEEPSSAATPLLTDLPFMVETKQICHSGDQARRNRWNNVPILSRKALVCVGDRFDDLINIDNFTRPKSVSRTQGCNDADEKLLTNLYQDGNKRDRSPAYGLMQQAENLDETITKSFLETKRTKFKELHGDNLSSPRALHERLDNTVFHGIVENMLRAVLAFDAQSPTHSLHDLKSIDSIKLNNMRLNDFDNLMLQVSRKMNAIRYARIDLPKYFSNLLQYDKVNNPRGIDSDGAQDVANIMADLIETICYYSSVDLTCVVDNNGADYSLYDFYKKRDASRSKRFKNFSQKFRTLYMIKSMSKAEVTINPDQPFAGFTQERYALFEKDGTMTHIAKKRKHTSVETLNDNALEFRYTPNYLDFSEEIADNYFMLGLVGMYISDAKSTGFNDVNLQTTIQLVPSSGDSNNQASEIIQTMTRNRGLDPTQIPSFVQLLGPDVEVYFDARLPQKKEHYDREYHRAQRHYRIMFQEKLAKQVAKDVRDWLYENLDAYDQVDDELFALHVDKIIAKNLRRLNNSNGHDIQLSTKEYHRVLKLFQKELIDEIENIQIPYELSLFVRILAAIINFFVRVFRFFSNIAMRFRLAKARKILRTKDANAPDVKRQLVYSKVLKTHSLASMMKMAFVAKEFKLLFDREKTIIEKKFHATKESLLTSQDKKMIADTLISATKLFYQPGDQVRIEAAINNTVNWVGILMEHGSQLEHLQNATSDEEKLDALKKLISSIVKNLFFDGKSLLSIQQYDEFINVSVAQFLKSDVLPELMLFLPAYSYNLVRDILMETKYPDQGDNALRLARHIMQRKSNINSSDEILVEVRAFFQADYPDAAKVESELKVEQEAQQHFASIQEDVMAIFKRHLSIPEASNNPLVVWWQQAKAVTSYVFNYEAIVNELSDYLQKPFLHHTQFALPTQEYEVLRSVLSQQQYAMQFARYLVEKADELQTLKQEPDSFIVLVSYLKECFENESFSDSFEHFRSTDELAKQTEESKEKIRINSPSKIEQQARAQLDILYAGQQQLTVLLGDNNQFEQHAHQIAKERLTQVMLHPEFIKLNKRLLNKLTQDDVVELLKAYEENNQSEKPFDDTSVIAQRVLTFVNLIEEDETQVLNQLDMTQLPDIQLALKRIADQIMYWHCQFEQTNRRGVQTISNVPQDVNDIRTIKCYQNPNSEVSFAASKLSYMQAIREALPDASKVSAHTNRGRIAILSFLKSNAVDVLIKTWKKSKNHIERQVSKVDEQQANQALTTDENRQTSYRRHALVLTQQLRGVQALKEDQVALNAKEYKDSIAPTITSLDGLIQARMPSIVGDSPVFVGENQDDAELDAQRHQSDAQPALQI